MGKKGGIRKEREKIRKKGWRRSDRKRERERERGERCIESGKWIGKSRAAKRMTEYRIERNLAGHPSFLKFHLSLYLVE